jgi:hypothetical protein
MEERLLSEGIIIREDKIKDFQNIFWDPNIELQIK